MCLPTNIQAGNGFLGFFNSPEQDVPTYDPSHDAICPVCLEMICAPVKTISLIMWDNERGHTRSYFYRIHKGCYEVDPNVFDSYGGGECRLMVRRV